MLAVSNVRIQFDYIKGHIIIEKGSILYVDQKEMIAVYQDSNYPQGVHFDVLPGEVIFCNICQTSQLVA